MKKIIYIFSIILLFLLASAYLFYASYVEQIEQRIYVKKSRQLQAVAQKLISYKMDHVSTITYILSREKKVLKAFEHNRTDEIDYTPLIQGVSKLGEYKNLWIHLIDANGISRYRSWTHEKGDDLKPIRADIVEMIKHPRQMNTVSTGKYDISFKTISPIWHHGKFIGMIELITHFNSIASRLKQMDILSLLLVEKSYSKRLTKPFSGKFISGYYLANLNADERLVKAVKDHGLTHLLAHHSLYCFLDGYLVTDYRIPDIHGNPMGHFLLFYPLDKIDMSAVSRFTIRFLVLFIAALIVLILIFILVLYRRYAERLNREVEKKTETIRTKSEELSSLLQTYDRTILFSQTDLNGTITAVSQAFCDASGYHRNELIGSSHRIVRHPEMPSSLFEKLWHTIKEQQWVHLEIKNRRKDGKHFWISTDIGPAYDIEGIHIGYRAIGQDITAIKDIEQIQKEVIVVLGSIGESHSAETGAHVRRVGAVSRKLAELYGLSEEEIQMIEMAAPMHDIGKIVIPDHILNKKGTLSDEEWEVMQTHAYEGYKLLSVSERPLLKMAATIAYEHHEKYDGSGYPRGLKGEKISIYGRIVALADVFDALSHDRCYKMGWEKDEIITYISEQRGKHFDPKLVDIFLSELETFFVLQKIYNQHP